MLHQKEVSIFVTKWAISELTKSYCVLGIIIIFKGFIIPEKVWQISIVINKLLFYFLNIFKVFADIFIFPFLIFMSVLKLSFKNSKHIKNRLLFRNFYFLKYSCCFLLHIFWFIVFYVGFFSFYHITKEVFIRLQLDGYCKFMRE